MKNNTLQFQTVKPILRSSLEHLMTLEDFAPFRLVGGTSLSLRYGHRMSDDIDLFTDAEYGSLDFHHLQDVLRREFPYCSGDCREVISFGVSYLIGNSKENCVKLDLFYTDTFIRPAEQHGNIRIAAVDDIVAMKMDVLTRGGRKKDFWDLYCTIIIALNRCYHCMKNVTHMEQHTKNVLMDCWISQLLIQTQTLFVSKTSIGN